MGYCFIHIDKIKSQGTLTSKMNHNFRLVEVSNTDQELKEQNEELIRLPRTKLGEPKNYKDVINDRINELPAYQNRKPRKDAVLAFEVVTTFSREENIDIESWKKKNVEWLRETFDKAPDGKSNVISVVYHADEPGNVHCHAIDSRPEPQKGESAIAYAERAMDELNTVQAAALRQKLKDERRMREKMEPGSIFVQFRKYHPI